MLDGSVLKSVPFYRFLVSKHFDGVYISRDILRKKLCSLASHDCILNIVQLNFNMSLDMPSLGSEIPKTFAVILRAWESR